MAGSAFLKVYPTGTEADFFLGNCQIALHKNWIEIQDYKHDFTQAVTTATRSSDLGPVARCTHEGVGFKKFNDKSSMNLMNACWIGQCLDLKFCIYRTLGGKNPVDKANKSMVILLKRAYITSFTLTPGTEEGGTEDIKVVYNYIQYGFAELDFAKGTVGTVQNAIDWNWSSNEISSAKADWT